MKMVFAICVSLILAGLGYFYVVKMAAVPHFGPPFAVSASTPLKEVATRPDALGSGTIRVEGIITRQCPSSGCWFFLKDEQGTQVRVELGHMGMKFPQALGKTAIVEGRVLASDKGIEVIGHNVEFR
jgi:hypothetical protein